MILSKEYYTWIPEHQIDKVVRVKDLFSLSFEISENPEKEKILSLTQRGIIERDVSKNEGQLPESFKEYNKIKKGDIVLNPMDLLTGWVDVSTLEGLISPSYKVLRPKKKFNVEFYCFQFQRYYREKIIFSFGEGVSYQYRWGLNNSTLLNFPLIFCQPEIQDELVLKIKNQLGEINNDILLYEEKIKLLKELKDSIVKEVIESV